MRPTWLTSSHKHTTAPHCGSAKHARQGCASLCSSGNSHGFSNSRRLWVCPVLKRMRRGGPAGHTERARSWRSKPSEPKSGHENHHHKQLHNLDDDEGLPPWRGPRSTRLPRRSRTPRRHWPFSQRDTGQRTREDQHGREIPPARHANFCPTLAFASTPTSIPRYVGHEHAPKGQLRSDRTSARLELMRSKDAPCAFETLGPGHPHPTWTEGVRIVRARHRSTRMSATHGRLRKR